MFRKIMYIYKLVYGMKDPRKCIRFLMKNRRLWILSIILFSLCLISLIKNHQSNDNKRKIESFDEVKVLLEQLFDSSISLIDIQNLWNRLIKIWQRILIKFLNDACQYCSNNQSDCYQSIDLIDYIYHINQTFYPYNENQRPNAMGIYYYFDLKILHSLNNTILSTDIIYCDYFHIIQLTINVQLILHHEQIKYFVGKGTFIGVLRHHDIIPWDTDIDLFIPLASVSKLLKVFQKLNKNRLASKYQQSYQKSLVIYSFTSVYNVTTYKIFSLHSSQTNSTYRWPKLDILTYEENVTHIYAYAKQQYSVSLLYYIEKKFIEPIYLRLFGPILMPSPYHPRKALRAMMKYYRSNVFYVCEGNTFLHRYNRKADPVWRLPCHELYTSYAFVQAQRNSTNNLCYEQLRSYQQNQSLSFYIYKCDEHLQRTFINEQISDS